MKFCPECGSYLNNNGECDTCGYNKVTNSDNKREIENIICGGPINTFYVPKTIPLDELKELSVETGELKSIYYSYSNGMIMNDIHKYSVNFIDKYIEKQDNIIAENKMSCVRYSISDKELENIKSKIEEYNLPAWSKIELNAMMMPSDISKSLTITYKMDGLPDKNYNIYYFCNMNKEERKIYNDFMSYIYSLAKEENIISNKDNKLVENKVELNLSYCPECGLKLEENTNKCKCGYEIKR